MLSERLLSSTIRGMTNQILKLEPTTEAHLPAPEPGKTYMLYAHVPFCERLCPYCSFNRFPFEEQKARNYFQNLRREMLMLKNLGYDFASLYIGGGTPTILIDELCKTIDMARENFNIKEVSSETNPNHLTRPYLEALKGRVQRLSVGVQSFSDDLLAQMDRLEKYGSGNEIFERIVEATPYFKSMNVDMIFNFPAQTEDILIRDVERVALSTCTQTTFYPLMASPAVEHSLSQSVGSVDYDREYRFYQIIDGILCGGANEHECECACGSELEHESNCSSSMPLFEHGSAWTFNRINRTNREENASVQEVPASKVSATSADSAEKTSAKNTSLNHSNSTGMIDEYVVEYEEYPAIGSGGITYLGKNLYINTFSINEYNEQIQSGCMSVSRKTTFSKRNRMRYRFMMQLFGLRLDKKQFKRDFGCSVEVGLPAEMAFMTANKAFRTNTSEELTLTARGRYLTVVMMRQFFIGVNNLRDQARAALPASESKLIFGC